MTVRLGFSTLVLLSTSRIQSKTFVTNAPEVKTAAANAVLRVEGKGAILQSHFVENRSIRTKKLMHIYPVLYIPGLSVKLLSMGVFLHDKQEVC